MDRTGSILWIPMACWMMGASKKRSEVSVKPEDIDFPASYDWARHYDPSLPPIDDRTPQERRIDEGVAKAMMAIEAEMNGDTALDASDPSIEERIRSLERAFGIHSDRLDHLQVTLTELRPRQKDAAKAPKKKGFDIPPSA